MVWGHLLFAGALLALRLQLVHDLEFGFFESLGMGLGRGLLYDVAAIATFGALPALFKPWMPRTSRALWAISLVALWAAVVANVLYFRWFGMRLDWWVLRLHADDFGMVKGSAGELGTTAWVIISALLLVAGVIVGLWLDVRADHEPVWAKRAREAGKPGWHVFGLKLTPGMAFILLAICGWRMPDWVNAQRTTMILSDQIVRVWWYETTRQHFFPGAQTIWLGGIPQGASQRELTDATQRLAEFRDGVYPPAVEPTREAPSAPGAPSEYPLLRTFTPDAELQTKLRTQLGLPADRPVNIVMFFVESLRSYELEHPELGPKVLPNVRRLFAEHAIYFPQAYSSSFTAGQTVRGQYSTQCSMYPNVLGAAPYIGHTTVRVRCLLDVLAESNYELIWWSSFKSTFHSKRQFETQHGMQRYYDLGFFESKGITQTLGPWGIDDRPVFNLAVDELNAVAKEGKPLYVNMINTSTHHPHTFLPQAGLDPALVAANQHDAPYLGYLSRLKYADGVIGEFFERVFKTPLADNTVFVVLGDHSVPVRPTTGVEGLQRIEYMFRVPIALVTKNIQRPERIERQVHQVDIAPTVADIAGVSGEVTWIGRGLYADVATPWVYQAGNALHYRTGEHACYTQAGAKLACYDLAGVDPLWTPTPPPAAEVPGQSDFFRAVLRADLYSVAMNRIAPPKTPR